MVGSFVVSLPCPCAAVAGACGVETVAVVQVWSGTQRSHLLDLSYMELQENRDYHKVGAFTPFFTFARPWLMRCCACVRVDRYFRVSFFLSEVFAPSRDQSPLQFFHSLPLLEQR